ncbi:MAG TPA: hypothetical protein DHW82_04500 [Spirochaetia bacterium]|nr:MAG: hypothetical protein A2Y41_11870 [Spirochaetes bacterium GWB1_36_13]HCL56254.1 hypothetical protein [Spirochaetia bacterium]
MKKIILILLLLWIPSYFFALSGEEILKKSDEQWVPDICSYLLTMKTIESGGDEKENQFKGFKKGSVKNVMTVVKPKKISGSVFLRKDDVIFSYYTTNHKLNKVAYQSLFMGSLLSYGDVLATELSFDYNVSKTEETGEDYILTLTPKQGQSGYGKVVIQIGKKDFLPKKRDYYALSGILLKSCVFNKIEFDGKNLSYMEQEFFEPLKERKTIVSLSSVEILKDIPEKYYNENFIQYLSGLK